DDDQSQILRRSEHCAASPHYDLDLAAGYATPVSGAFGVAQVAVQHRHAAATAAELLDRLWSQADFGNQDDRFLALTHDFRDGLQIDLGFSAPCYAVEQEGMKSPLA